MTKTELLKLKSKLPPEYREQLATETGYSIAFVDKVLSGLRKNIKIIKAALALAKSYQEELNKISKEIKKL